MRKYLKVSFLIVGTILLLSILSLFGTSDRELGNGYVYYPENKMISSSDGNYGEIPSTVLGFDYDKNFIIAEQRPIENDPNVLLYDFDYKYFKGYTVNYFWLIIKKDRKIFGPLDEKSFNQLRKKYNVPNSLSF